MNKERAKRLLRMFGEEIEDHLGSLSNNLLAMERGDGPAAQALDDVFRSFHTLKGSARALGAGGLEAICHRLEDELTTARAESRPLSRALVDIALRSLDVIRAIKARSLDLPADDPLVAGFLAELEAAITGKPLEVPALPPPVPPPPFAAEPAPAIASVPAAPAAAPAPVVPAVAQDVIRVTAAKLDSLMNRVGELLITRIKTVQRVTDMDAVAQSMGRVSTILAGLRQQAAAAGLDESAWHAAEEHVRELDRKVLVLHRNLTADIGRMALVSRELEDDVRALRLLPFAEGVGMLNRLVRDTALATGKEVALRVEGGDTEVDKGILEGLREPIIHLINNAIDHGIERPEDRAAAGKPREGLVRVRARQRGVRFVVEVSDDGRGIDVEAVRAKAGQIGLVPRDRLASLSREECLDLLFKPGFTTAKEVTRISGRGVGMDVVREQLTRLHGTCELQSETGRGTTCTLSLPLTLITTQALLVRCERELMAIPTTAVERTLELPLDALVKVDTQDAIRVEGHPVAAVKLSKVLEIPSAHLAPPPAHRVVLLADGARRVAILVDDIEGEQEIVHKTLGKQYVRVRNVSGATILGTGRVVVILNPQDLIVNALEARPAA